MAASWSSNPAERRKNSLPDTPSTGSDPTRQRDACAPGTNPPPVVYAGEAAPDNQHPTTSGLEPDASRTLPYPPHVWAALRLFDAIADLGVGDPAPNLHRLPRSLFDTLPGAETWYAAVGEHAEAFWVKTLETPAGQRCPVFTWEPPVETEAAA